jgi:ATP-dependent helicase Lhr and Lhr-like helicase
MPLPLTEEVLARLHPGICRWVRHEARWRDLSPIQLAAIPAICSGVDCVIEAPTAGGKTEAVLFPTLTRAAEATGGGVRVLYLAPLRALLNNLQGRGEHYAALCNLRAFKWHGDVGQKEKLEALSDPPHLLMTTPESLEAILLRKPGWKDLFAELGAIIVDEAHNFAAGDRGGHLLSLLERVAEATRRPPQRIALSATLGNPKAMLRWLAGSRRSEGQRVAVEAPPRQDCDFRILFFDDAAETQATPPEERASYRRFAALQDLLAGSGAAPRLRSLVFVRSRRGAEALASGFVTANTRLPHGRRLQVRTHHSAVSRFFREEAERLIQIASEDGLDAIISTSTLELGIDIGELRQVIQVDALSSPSSFLQRVGRTGRRPGKPQVFRGLVTQPDDLVLLAATVSLGRAGRSEALLLPRRAFHLLAHQLLCLALQSFGVRPDRAWDVLKGADCFAEISRPELDLLIDHMVQEAYLRRADGHLVVGEKTESAFLHSNWRRLFAVFDSAPLYEVLHRRQQVGTLDARFVESLEAPFFFVLGAKLWRADRVDSERRVVSASPSQVGSAPAWLTFGGPGVPFETAQEAGRILHEEIPPSFLDDAGKRAFRGLQRQAAGDGWVPLSLSISVFPSGSAQLITFAGDRINRTLARVLSLAGVGQAVASYWEVRVKKGPGDREAMVNAVSRALADLRSGWWSDARSLARALEATQPLWPFSPFASCLPQSLWAAALVEQSLDPGGLLRLLQRDQPSGSR